MIKLLDFVTVLGALISLLLLFLLLKEKKRGLHKNILIFIFSFICFTSISFYAYLQDLDWLLYTTALFDFNLFWVLGPFLLLYIKSIFFDSKGLVKSNLHHFLPSILLTLFVEIPLFLDFEYAYLKYIYENQLPFILIRDTYFIVYIVISIRLFLNLQRAFNKKLQLSIQGYNWIYKLLIGCLVFASIDLFIRLFESFGFSLGFEGGYVTFSSIVIFLVYFGYHSINEARFLIPSFLMDTSDKETSHFSEEDAKAIGRRIKDVLEKEKLYLDEALTLKKLSDSTGISEKKISAFLNNHLDTGFKAYINLYRVEEVKQKLKSEEYNKLTLVAISEECGFNSKASFYRIFKKHTGISPSQYKKSLK